MVISVYCTSHTSSGRHHFAGWFSRGAVANAMTQGPAYEARWVDQLYDALRVGRVAPDSRSACTDLANMATDTGQWASFVRDHKPQTQPTMTGGTLRDLAISSLRLDNLTPFLRGRLMGELSATDEYSKLPDKAQIEATRRLTMGERFLTGYLGRNMLCLPCHNSKLKTAGLDFNTPEGIAAGASGNGLCEAQSPPKNIVSIHSRGDGVTQARLQRAFLR